MGDLGTPGVLNTQTATTDTAPQGAGGPQEALQAPTAVWRSTVPSVQRAVSIYLLPKSRRKTRVGWGSLLRDAAELKRGQQERQEKRVPGGVLSSKAATVPTPRLADNMGVLGVSFQS